MVSSRGWSELGTESSYSWADMLQDHHISGISETPFDVGRLGSCSPFCMNERWQKSTLAFVTSD